MWYTKLFQGILYSSVWAEDDKTRLVWITMLALADGDGIVRARAPGIANAAKVPIKATREALKKFEAPDPDSRTEDHEGRRIQEVPDGYLVLNYVKYREQFSAERERELTRERVRKHRAKVKAETICNGPVTDCNEDVTPGNDIYKEKENKNKKDPGVPARANGVPDGNGIPADEAPLSSMPPKNPDLRFLADQFIAAAKWTGAKQRVYDDVISLLDGGEFTSDQISGAIRAKAGKDMKGMRGMTPWNFAKAMWADKPTGLSDAEKAADPHWKIR